MTHASATTIDSIKRSLVGLRMPRALEVLDTTVRRIEQGEIDGIGALDQILIEELTLRENRRVKTALLMARLTAIKTLQGFDFAFQPSLDRNRVLALAELKFIDRAEVVHLLGPPGTGKSHLATALAVEAVKAGHSVVFSTLADLIASRAGYVVDRYVDEAVGVLDKTWMSRVTLYPRVTFSGKAPSGEEHRALHHKAHDKCFIANSVKTEVRVEPC